MTACQHQKIEQLEKGGYHGSNIGESGSIQYAIDGLTLLPLNKP